MLLTILPFCDIIESRLNKNTRTRVRVYTHTHERSDGDGNPRKTFLRVPFVCYIIIAYYDTFVKRAFQIFAFVWEALLHCFKRFGGFVQPLQLNSSVVRTSLLLLGLSPRQWFKSTIERVSCWDNR